MVEANAYHPKITSQGGRLGDRPSRERARPSLRTTLENFESPKRRTVRIMMIPPKNNP